MLRDRRAAPTCTLALTGSYVVRTPPWSTTTTPRPASVAAKVTVPASEVRTPWPARPCRSTPRWPAPHRRCGRVEPRGDRAGAGRAATRRREQEPDRSPPVPAASAGSGRWRGGDRSVHACRDGAAGSAGPGWDRPRPVDRRRVVRRLCASTGCGGARSARRRRTTASLGTARVSTTPPAPGYVCPQQPAWVDFARSFPCRLALFLAWRSPRGRGLTVPQLPGGSGPARASGQGLQQQRSVPATN